MAAIETRPVQTANESEIGVTTSGPQFTPENSFAGALHIYYIGSRNIIYGGVGYGEKFEEALAHARRLISGSVHSSRQKSPEGWLSPQDFQIRFPGDPLPKDPPMTRYIDDTGVEVVTNMDTGEQHIIPNGEAKKI